MDNSPTIFLSYRSQQSDFALRLAADLKNAGVRLWMDRLDGIHVGMDWRETLRNALQDSPALIAVISPEYLASSYCRRELGRADTLKHTVYPLMLRPVQPQNMPLQLEGIQYEDFTGWPNEHDYLKQLNKLILRLTQEAPNLLGEQPDIEVQYLNSLRAKLEQGRGVLQYVDLEADVHVEDMRPEPTVEDEWGFSELLPEVKRTKPTEVNVLQNIKEIKDKYSKFILIGEPGTGKTTTLRRLARDAALKRMENPRLNPLPVFIRMSEWTNQLSTQAFFESQLPFADDLAYRPPLQDLSFYLDGLNEMGEEKSEKTKLLNAWLTSKHGPKYVVITCRASDYTYLGRELTGVPAITVRPLTDDQIRIFVYKYLRNRAGAFLASFLNNAAATGKKLSYSEKTFRQTHRLSDLVKNPYMLSALIYLYENSPEKEIPQTSGILLQRLVRALWKREQQRGTVEGRHYEDVERQFSGMAFRMTQNKSPLDISIDAVLESGKETTLLQEGHALNYIIVRGDHVRFYHQLIQEFFAAVELEKHDLSTIVEPFGLEYGPNYIWLKYNFESRWYLPVIFACEISENPALKIRQISVTNPLLATECLDILPVKDPALVEHLSHRTLAELNIQLTILLEKQVWVAENRGASGKWDDIEDSIVDSIEELYSYGSGLLVQLGNPVRSILSGNTTFNKRLVTETINKMERMA